MNRSQELRALMTGTGQQAKSSTFHTTADFIRAEFGDDTFARVLASLSPEARAGVERVSVTDELDYELLRELWTETDEVVGSIDAGWMERAGAFSIGLRGAQMYGGILRKKDPDQFLTQSISLFRLYYRPGDMVVVAHEAGRAVLRLVGFESGTPLFCRRQTGGLTKAIELAGGDHASTRHVRCELEGDAFCEWELTWGSADKTPRDVTRSA
jgi:hypothetical protein